LLRYYEGYVVRAARSKHRDVRCAPLPLSCRQVGIARHEGCGAGAPCPAWRADTRQYIEYSPHITGERSTALHMSAWYDPVTLTLPRSADASRRLDDHDGPLYIILGCVFRRYSALCTFRPPPRAPAATWTGTPKGDRIKPSQAGAQIGFSSRGRGTSRRRAAAAHRRVVGAPRRPP
jgi:hypothetical protein